MSDANSEKLKEKYVELSMLDAQIKQFQKELEKFDEKLMEVVSVRNDLDDLKTVKQNTSIFVPVNQGIFVGAKIEDTDKLFVNVGGNIIVEKNVSEAKKLLDDQVSEMEKHREQIASELQKMFLKAQNLQQETMSLSE